MSMVRNLLLLRVRPPHAGPRIRVNGHARAAARRLSSLGERRFQVRLKRRVPPEPIFARMTVRPEWALLRIV
jgi:hypothetical protein